MARPTDISAKRRLPTRLPKPLLLLRSDEQLVELVRDGDETAFEVLYERHADRLLEFCGQMLGSPADAEEALRHSFQAARFYIAGGGRDVAFEPWLYTIAGNHCLTVLRERRIAPMAPVERLDEWRQRRRRGRFGLALPAAPAFALQQGVAALGGPGIVAKAAVVIGVLASGAGVTTEAVRQDHGGAAAAPPPVADVRAHPDPAARARAEGCRPGCGEAPERAAARGRPRPPAEGGGLPAEPVRAPRGDGDSPSADQSPRTTSRGAAAGPGGAPAWRPAAVPPVEPAEIRHGELDAPAGDVAPPAIVPEVVSQVPVLPVEAPPLPKLGKDGRVTVKIPPIDRRPSELARQVKRLLPRDR